MSRVPFLAYIAVTVLLLGVAGCSSGSKDRVYAGGSDEESTFSSTSKVEESHTFKGTGTRIVDFLEDKELVTLSGKYFVTWEIAENGTSSGESSDGAFDLSFFCEVDPEILDLEQMKIVNEYVSEGSGEKAISIPKPQRCQINVVAAD